MGRILYKYNPVALLILTALLVSAFPGDVFAMHITEGILPVKWAALWFIAALPFLARGLHELNVRSASTPYFKSLIGLVGAAVFIISCMPIPVPFAGTSSHPCGTGLAAIIIGPWLSVLVASVALVLQALFLAHGGLTTLGANIVSMGVVGAFTGYGAFKISRSFGASLPVAFFLAGMLSDWATYAMTSFELATALSGSTSFSSMFFSILLAFVPTQVPLGILEGILCAGACRFISERRPELISFLTREEPA
jgi:cobalt/nickel transport system permease protein